MDELELISKRDQHRLEKLLNDKIQSAVVIARGQSEIDLALRFISNKLKRLEVFEAYPDNTGSIKIDVIRKLLESTINSPHKRRYFLIMNAEKMNIIAQNALLKSLEEPNSKNFFFLLTTNQSSILPTVLSRAQKLKLQPLSTVKIRSFLKTKYPEFDILNFKQTEFIANDNFKLWEQLIVDPNLLKSYLEIAQIARLVVTQASLIDRLIAIRQIGKDRDRALILTKLVTKIYTNLIVNQTNHRQIKNLETWLIAQDKLSQSAAVQLTLTEAVL